MLAPVSGDEDLEPISFLITLAAAFLLGAVGHRLRLPAGAMVGGIIGTMIVNLFLGGAYFYADIKIGLQLMSGAMIGSKIGMSDVREMKKIILPTLFLLVGMVLLNLVFGALMATFSSLDIPTALFAAAPGGMADMALISTELGANPAYVGILQLVRVLTIFICMPPLFKKILSGKEIAPPVDDAQAEGDTSKLPLGVHARKLLLLIAVSAAGGLLFRALGVAAGALSGSMIAGTLLCIFRGKVPFPSSLRFVLQVLSGVFIGVGIDWEAVATLPELVVPALIMIVGIFAFVFVTAGLMHKIFKIDKAVCYLASTPGGVQEMALLSEDLGADTPKIAVMQTTRLMSVILFFPTMLEFITLALSGL